MRRYLKKVQTYIEWTSKEQITPFNNKRAIVQRFWNELQNCVLYTCVLLGFLLLAFVLAYIKSLRSVIREGIV